MKHRTLHGEGKRARVADEIYSKIMHVHAFMIGSELITGHHSKFQSATVTYKKNILLRTPQIHLKTPTITLPK